MRTRTIFALVLVLVLMASLMSGVVSAKANPAESLTIPAKDVELVKKGIVKGPPPSAAGSKRQTGGVATGVLGETSTRSKYAIVIGISDYPGTGSDLEFCDDDALLMKAVLEDVYGFQPKNVIVLIDDQAKNDNILDAINQVKDDASPGDEVIFFYSGHGASGIADDGDREKKDEAIVCWNEAGNDFAYIWDGQLRQWFAGFETSRIVFVFDSCYAGGMTDLAAEGRIINMASEENTLSYELTGLAQGEFTYYFVEEGMQQGKADIYDHNKDGTANPDVVVEEAFDYAKANCRYDKPTISDKFVNDLLP